MVIQVEDDGGATIRLSKIELVGYYNHFNNFLNHGTTWADGSPIPPEVLRSHQLHELAVAIGRDDVPRPDYWRAELPTSRAGCPS